MKVYCGSKAVLVLWSSFGVSLQWAFTDTSECFYFKSLTSFACIRGRHPPEVWKLSQQKLRPLFFTSKTESLNHYHFSKVYMDAICYRPPTRRAQMQLIKVELWLVALVQILTTSPVESSVPLAHRWQAGSCNIYEMLRKSQKQPHLTVGYRCIARACEYVVDSAPRLTNTHCWRRHLRPHTLICCFHSLTLVLLGVSGETGPQKEQGRTHTLWQERHTGEVC